MRYANSYRRGALGIACLGIIGFGAGWPVPARAQVIGSWTHQAAFGDASAAVAMNDTLMFVAINEDEVLRLYARYPGSACATEIYALDARPDLGESATNPGADLESAVELVDGHGRRIYWLGSLSNTKNGNLRPNRDRLFATQVTGNGTGSPPYSLSYVGRYDHLREDLIAWDKDNLHGKGANYYGLEASAASGVPSTAPDGFNVEGLALAPDGRTAYVAFRTPFVNGSGPTTAPEQRTHALIVPVVNLPALVAGSPTPGPGAAQFGAPITLDLGGRGVRSLDRNALGNYLITAGPADDPSNPPAAPLDFRLFTWTGFPGGWPIERSTDILAGWSPEGAILPGGPLADQSVIQFVSDDATACWRSFTAAIGSPHTTDVPRAPAAAGEVRFSRPPAPDPGRGAVSFAVTLAREETVDLAIDDLEGRRVATLFRGALSAGEHGFSWDGTTDALASAPAGVYWARCLTGHGETTRRFVLLH